MFPKNLPYMVLTQKRKSSILYTIQFSVPLLSWSCQRPKDYVNLFSELHYVTRAV